MKKHGHITILLPFYLNETFVSLFEDLGFSVIWAKTKQELEKIVEFVETGLAIEWQHAERDFTIRDLLRQYNKEAKIFLALNWNRKIPPDFEQLGYFDVLKVPFDPKDIRLKFCNALPSAKKITASY